MDAAQCMEILSREVSRAQRGSQRLQVVFDDFAEAVYWLACHTDVPFGCPRPTYPVRYWTDEPWPSLEEVDDAATHLERSLASDGEVGTGSPIAYLGRGDHFVLIRESATEEQIVATVGEVLRWRMRLGRRLGPKKTPTAQRSLSEPPVLKEIRI